ncbi:hypothetical protein HDA40_006926 [Hamadaea flava]|uniref:NADH dehydrogenase subunit 6 n=1 Tax=Hamadaea flava TaxID=1742688 RepID=A0ABV8M0K6_9ACTN|nr:hypothetical protein [Hamadaea flava]MCP2328419.1 hypothetical protein [Hamadaea flava]
MKRLAVFIGVFFFAMVVIVFLGGEGLDRYEIVVGALLVAALASTFVRTSRL